MSVVNDGLSKGSGRAGESSDATVYRLGHIPLSVVFVLFGSFEQEHSHTK